MWFWNKIEIRKILCSNKFAYFWYFPLSVCNLTHSNWQYRPIYVVISLKKIVREGDYSKRNEASELLFLNLAQELFPVHSGFSHFYLISWLRWKVFIREVFFNCSCLYSYAVQNQNKILWCVHKSIKKVGLHFPGYRERSGFRESVMFWGL